ncbi:helix-turn-helix domain-containing protein [Actinomadura parmotrematis]|uniref:Helix-turn-helix domain-containing protein n=1 Tax=Actinomadura parmotrematis TaxID=2864039 RepID=A0ABS7FQ32_9ACTN|nr:helix-turn-helix domain-containing protein [Actinomadura parmotrematis]MBW8482510.1 helix-turn-helix domain-containing protein [Actinomadura parmotrematis]
MNALAREVAERRLAVLPGYSGLPRDLRDVEVAATARFAIRRFLAGAGGVRSAEDGLAPFRERAAQRAEEGLDLGTLLHTYHLGAEAVWHALCEEARPGEEEALRWLGAAQLRGLGRVVAAVASAYQAEQAAVLADRSEALREVARSLLAGEDAAGAAARRGVPLAAAYLVLHPLPTGEGEIADRRLLRRMRARLDGLADEPPLTIADERGTFVLVPVPEGDAPPLAEPGDGEAAIVGAARSRGVADVPAAAGQAVRVARVARASGRPPGLYRMGDVLLDYHLSGATDSGPAVAALLDPLDGRPELLATLGAFTAQDMDRRRTARALGVHPNTVDNRLARVARLTGADPRTARGLLLCAAALALRRLG